MTRPRPPMLAHLKGGPSDGTDLRWQPQDSSDRILVPHLPEPADPLAIAPAATSGLDLKVAVYERTRVLRGIYLDERDAFLRDYREGYHVLEAVYTYRGDQ